MAACKIENCSNDHLAKGYCTKHYKRWYKFGDPLVRKCAANGERKRHPLYAVYMAMIQRCYDPAKQYYEDYGGRGIKVCEAWLGVEGFPAFLADMGERL